MVRFDNTKYVFDTPDGPKRLLDLFGEQQQLVVYQFMDLGPDEYCPGCTHFTNYVADLPALAKNGVAWATVSNMPLARIRAYADLNGWNMPFVSSHDTSFAIDCGIDGGFLISVFLRDGDEVYRTYSTTARGVDRLLFVNNILDLAPYGRRRTGRTRRPGGRNSPGTGRRFVGHISLA